MLVLGRLVVLGEAGVALECGVAEEEGGGRWLGVFLPAGKT